VLPSFRLIAATFLCSFLIVFVGLRVLATSHVTQETAGRASNALPLQLTGMDAGADLRRVDRNAPAVFDLRFAMGAMAPSSVPSGLTMHAIDRAKRESGLDFPEQVVAPPAIEPDQLDVNIEAKPEPKIEVAALPEPIAAAADTPPPPPGPPAALAALETNSPDVESVGTTQAASGAPVVKKSAVAKRKAAKRKLVKRARAKQAQTTQPAIVPFPDPFQH
jgi:hypothetical protein